MAMTTSTSADRLRQFSQAGYDEYDRSGIADLESTLITQGGRRSLGDISRIGADAGGMSDRIFAGSAAGAERQRRGLGLNISGAERESLDRRMGLARVLGNVDARNRALMADQQRRGAIRTDAFGLRDIIDRQITANLGAAAGIEESASRDAAAARASNTDQKASSLGSTAGMLLGIFGDK